MFMPSSRKKVTLRSLEKLLLRTLRCLPIRQHHREWIATIQCDPHLDTMLRGKGDYQTRHLQSYMHRQWRAAQKLDTIRTHIAFILQHIHLSHHQALYGIDGIRYGEPGYLGSGINLMQWDTSQARWRIVLLHSQHNKEGELQLSLRDGDDREVYFIVFSVGHAIQQPDQHALYIGCLQGARPENGGTTLINAFYKQNNGLRAQSILLTALYSFTRVTNIRFIYGISDSYTINSRYRKKIKTSYNNFWLECHAKERPDGWYLLPEHEEMRSIETVKSKHRSAFRKREAWREEAQLTLVAAFLSLQQPQQ